MLPPQQGQVVEEYVRRLAGDLGLPDLVYRPTVVQTGSGNRERSDGLLICGDDGLIVQVKSRDGGAAQGDDLERAERWCRKNGLEAERQGKGTRRAFNQGPVELENMRGYSRLVSPGPDWPIAVVLDHPLNPRVVFDEAEGTLFLTLDDWHGLHAMVRSTAGVIDYVRRALQSSVQIPLGLESERYAQLAAADAEWAASRPGAVPLLPLAPPSGSARLAADLFDDLVERAADSRDATAWGVDEYVATVEELDRTPILSRVDLGSKLLQTIRAVDKAGKGRRGFLSLDRESGRRFVALCQHAPRTLRSPSR
jgi:hypothetical protein